MATWTALTTLPGEAAAQALGAALEGLAPHGVGVFEVEDGAGLWEVGGYFDSPPDPVALALLAAAHGARDFAVSELPEIDWVAHVRRELAPVEAGRFFVHGSHDAERVPPGREGLLIEAAMAFGTGHHGTTRGCLLALEALAADGPRIGRAADIGCGTAVLAMAAARLWPRRDLPEVIAADIDPVAVEVATANTAVNGLADRVRCLQAAGFDHPALAGPFELILANILKGPLLELAPEIAARLAPGGHAILSGLLTAQAAEVAAACHDHGLRLLRHEDLGDWRTLTLQRPA